MNDSSSSIDGGETEVEEPDEEDLPVVIVKSMFD